MGNAGEKCAQDALCVDPVVLIKAPVLDGDDGILEINGDFIKPHDVAIGSGKRQATDFVALLITQISSGFLWGDGNRIDRGRGGDQTPQKKKEKQTQYPERDGSADQNFAPGKMTQTMMQAANLRK